MFDPTTSASIKTAPITQQMRRKRNANASKANSSAKALQAACLTATLATAFTANPAPVRADLLTDQSVEIFSAIQVNYTFDFNTSPPTESISTSTINDSRQFATQTASLDDYGIVIFLNSSGSSLAGQAWSDLFPSVDETALLDYLHNGGGSALETANYNTFLESLINQSANQPTFNWLGTVFSNGQNVGSVPVTLTSGNNVALFGVARHIQAVPEAGSAWGLLTLATLSVATWQTGVWRRKRRLRVTAGGLGA